MATKNKKILFITHLYYPSLGGSERVFKQLAEGFSHKGFDVTVLTSDALSAMEFYTGTDNNLPTEEIINNVRVFRDPIRSWIYKFMKFFRLIKRLGSISFSLASLFEGPHYFNAYKKLFKQEFDVVIAGPTPTSAIFYGLLYKLFHLKTKLIVFPMMHIDDNLHTSFINFRVLSKADLIFTFTDIEKKYLIKRGIKDEKIFKVGSGVNENLLGTIKKQYYNIEDYVLYLGQEGHHKNIPLLIEAMKKIWKRDKKYKLVIAGARSRYSSYLDNLIEDFPPDIKNMILRFNNISKEQKLELLDKCNILINPSSHESFGIVFIEAWARKKPVIGSNIKAVREIIKDGTNGLLFEDQNQDDLAEKILSLLNNENKRKDLGESGYQSVQEIHNWGKIINSVVPLLSD